MDFGTLLRKGARQFGSAEAVVCEGRSQTHAELYERGSRLANGLADLGVRPGDRVAMLGDNGAQVIEQIAGLALGGFVRAALYTHATAESNVYLLDMVGARVLLVQARYHEAIAPHLEGLPALDHVVVYDDDAGRAPDGTIGYEQLMAGSSPADPGVRLDPDDLHIIRFSAGTTGKSKGICHTGAAWMAMGNEFALFLPPLEETDRYLAAAPMAHAAGLPIWPVLAAGGAVVVLPAFDPVAVLDAIERERATLTLLVPTMIQTLVNHPDAGRRDLSSLRAVLYGAAPIAERTLTDALALWGNIMYQVYGQSECLPSTVLPPSQHRLDGTDRERRRLRSAGRPAPNVDVAILDEQGTRLGVGEIGEIAVDSPGRMREIWSDPDATRQRVTEDGYVRSRDIGYLDEDGFLYIADRMEDMIISGGFNIWPTELENAIAGHPAVLEVAVFGVPHDRWGETPKAIVVLREGAEADADELLLWCREKVGPTKKVTSVEFADDLPKSALGKVLRGEVKRRYWSGQDRVAGA